MEVVHMPGYQLFCLGTQRMELYSQPVKMETRAQLASRLFRAAAI